MERTRRAPITRARGVGAIREASQLCELVHAMIGGVVVLFKCEGSVEDLRKY